MTNQVLHQLLKNTESFAKKDLDLLTGVYNKTNDEEILKQ